MGKLIEVETNKYKLIKDYKEAFNIDDFASRYTDYFEDYDYIVGDIAYSKLRLKGFYNQDNKKVKKINNYQSVDKYISEYCANDCKYFILEKVK